MLCNYSEAKLLQDFRKLPSDYRQIASQFLSILAEKAAATKEEAPKGQVISLPKRGR